MISIILYPEEIKRIFTDDIAEMCFTLTTRNKKIF
ncbi:hypothetical protein SAMN05444406_1385 [Caldicoprobacter faecalis]|uniref:Uncharacterized protein n=1 Tax=Caldicoprobacter faecalis TaxID=937334 RepID=A0A1I5Y6K5_9FIRM|nr:hypothetical protein SAMN05444406_1385 [Caldicoprobacter faecalis]